MSEIDEYEITCHYHRPETAQYKILARNVGDAMEIAKINFWRGYNHTCVLDTVEWTNDPKKTK